MQGSNKPTQLQRLVQLNAEILRVASLLIILSWDNNKDADQTARMCRLVCAFDVRMQLRQVFSRHGP